MIESPVLQQLKTEWTQEGAREGARKAHRKDIIILLVARFGDEARDFAAKLEMIDDEAQLSRAGNAGRRVHRPGGFS